MESSGSVGWWSWMGEIGIAMNSRRSVSRAHKSSRLHLKRAALRIWLHHVFLREEQDQQFANDQDVTIDERVDDVGLLPCYGGRDSGVVVAVKESVGVGECSADSFALPSWRVVSFDYDSNFCERSPARDLPPFQNLSYSDLAAVGNDTSLQEIYTLYAKDGTVEYATEEDVAREYAAEEGVAEEGVSEGDVSKDVCVKEGTSPVPDTCQASSETSSIKSSQTQEPLAIEPPIDDTHNFSVPTFRDHIRSVTISKIAELCATENFDQGQLTRLITDSKRELQNDMRKLRNCDFRSKDFYETPGTNKNDDDNNDDDADDEQTNSSESTQSTIDSIKNQNFVQFKKSSNLLVYDTNSIPRLQKNKQKPIQLRSILKKKDNQNESQDLQRAMSNDKISIKKFMQKIESLDQDDDNTNEYEFLSQSRRNQLKNYYSLNYFHGTSPPTKENLIIYQKSKQATEFNINEELDLKKNFNNVNQWDTIW